ncbi:MAG: CPBP family glutamic-type intramembrane protease [Bellilinea sp.]
MKLSYIDPARGENNQFWRYLLTFFAILWFSLGAGVILAVVAIAVEGSPDITTYSNVTMLLLTMLPFPFALLALWGGLKLLHKRGLMSLLHPGGGFSWAKVLLSGAIWFVLAGASDLVLWLIDPANYSFNFNPAAFFPFLLLTLVLVPVQTSTEELIIRGYLTQWMGRFSQKIWLPLIVPAVVFMALHGLNPEVGAYGMLLTLPLYLGIGLLLGWVTLKSGGLEMALGLHAANNLYATLLVTFPNTALPSPALFNIKVYDPLLALVQLVIVMVLYLGILYAWKRSWLAQEEEVIL